MKKGFFFSVGLVVVSVIVMTSALIALHKAKQPLQEPIGRKQFDIISMYQRGEEAKFFIEQSAKYSASDAVIFLAGNGGLSAGSSCQAYLGYRLWNQACPVNVREEFVRQLNLEFPKYLARYDISLPLSFSLSVQGDKALAIVGRADSPVRFDIDKVLAIPESAGLQPVFPVVVKKEDQELLQKIFDKYHTTIVKHTAKYPQVPASLIAAVIAKESAGDPLLVGCGGTCAGLMQFESDTAGKDFRHIFRNVPKAKYPSGGRVCDIQNDDRCDPEKSIQAGIEYYNMLLNMFARYTGKFEFAMAGYNGGQTVIKRVVESTGPNPSWGQVSANLKPETFFYMAESQRERKVKIVRDYVDRVMLWKQYYEVLQYGSSVQGYERNAAETTHACCVCEQICGNGCVLKAVPGNVDCFTWSSQWGTNCDMSFCSPPSQKPGTYEFTPVFKVGIDYDLNVYDEIIQAVKEKLVPQVSSISAERKMDDAVKVAVSGLSAADFKWSYDSGCDFGNDRVFNRFVEGFQLCAESKEINCICEFSMDFPADDGSYEIDVSVGTFFASKDRKLKVAYDAGYVFPVGTAVHVTRLADSKYKSIVYAVDYRKGSFDSAWINTKELTFQNWELADFGKDRGVVRLYREGGIIAFLSEEDYQDQNLPFMSLPKCSQDKKIFRFCVSKKSAPSLVYSFAVDFGKFQ